MIELGFLFLSLKIRDYGCLSVGESRWWLAGVGWWPTIADGGHTRRQNKVGVVVGIEGEQKSFSPCFSFV